MKTIFEGKVNNAVFNNVNDYNKALVEALKSNGKVCASSRTYTVNEEGKGTEEDELIASKENNGPDKEPNCCDQESCECENKSVQFFYGMEDDDEYYLDSITGGPEDAEILKSWQDGLDNSIQEIRKEFDNFELEDFQNYSEDLNSVLNKLKEDTTEIEIVSDKLDRSIEKLEKELNEKIDARAVVDNCKVLNTMFNKHYSKLYSEVKQNIYKFTNPEQPKQVRDFEIEKENFKELWKRIFPHSINV